MEWTTSAEPVPDSFDAERVFERVEVRLRKRDRAVWIEVGGYPPVVVDLGSLTELFVQPDLGTDGTEIVVAAPPSAYLLIGRGALGLDDVTAGEYDLTWVDLERGRIALGGRRMLDGAEEVFTAPLDGPSALVLRRIGR